MNKQELFTRLKSFAWRLGGITVVMLLTFIADNIGLFGLPLQAQVLIGLVLNEVTKQLNK